MMMCRTQTDPLPNVFGYLRFIFFQIRIANRNFGAAGSVAEKLEQRQVEVHCPTNTYLKMC